MALLIGGIIFWAIVAAALALLLFVYGVGIARALSLHRFLARVRRAVDGGLCPFRVWRIWPSEFVMDVHRLAGWPGGTHGVSYHFAKEDAPVSAHWHGIGDWKIGKRPSLGERDGR